MYEKADIKGVKTVYFSGSWLFRDFMMGKNITKTVMNDRLKVC
jgi:hypothetical protein